MSQLADYAFKIKHKKGADNVPADALSRLNLTNFDEEDMAFVEKIINLVGLQFNPEMEIIEYHEMMEAAERIEDEELEPLELNSFEFFSAQALFYFEGEAEDSTEQSRKLSSTEQSPANPVVS